MDVHLSATCIRLQIENNYLKKELFRCQQLLESRGVDPFYSASDAALDNMMGGLFDTLSNDETNQEHQ